MKHFLQLRILERTPELEISAEDYRAAKTARAVLAAALAVEEKWDFLLSNYIELEQELLSAAVTSIGRVVHEYREIFAYRANINRRFANLLTAARLYVDQMPQAISELGEGKDADQLATVVKALLSKQYEDSFEYRFMEAFRNHVQHRGLPTHSVQFGSKWTPEFDRKWQEAYVLAFVTRGFLVEDQKFKKSVLAETPDKVNLIDATRHYAERLGAVHKEVRNLASPRAANARATVQDLMDRYIAVRPGKPLGLAAHRTDDEGGEEFVSLFLDWDDVRIYLIDRNDTLTNLSKRTVSGRTNF